jgi:hypothetical protein
MVCKFLEISSGQNKRPNRFEIVEVEKDIYVLKTKNSHIGLVGTLDKWLKNNYSLRESSYSDMLGKRTSSPGNLLRKGVSQDLNVDYMGISG